MSPIPIGILAAQGGFSYNPVAAYDLISTQGTTIAFVNSFSFGSLGTLAANYKHIEFRVMANCWGHIRHWATHYESELFWSLQQSKIQFSRGWG